MSMIQIHYACDQNPDHLVNRFERGSLLSTSWFASNYLKFNTEKYQLLISRDKCEKTVKDIGEDKIWETSNIELLVIVIDNQLKFDRHISRLCSNTKNKCFDRND